MASIALGIAGAISAASSIAGGVNASNAAKTAAGQETSATGQAITNDQNTASTITSNAQPYLTAGSTSLGQLMTGLNNGTFGSGGQIATPTAPGSFVAPTLAQAQTDPGVQFAQQQGDLGILQGAAAAGGTITGGTLKNLAGYNNQLGQSAYNDVFNRDLQGYGANLQGYQAQLQGVQTQLQSQQQAFNQQLAPAALGAQETNSLNSGLLGVSNNIASLLTGKGQAQAAGTVGSANAIDNTIGQVANIGSGLVLGSNLFGNQNNGLGNATSAQGLGKALSQVVG